MSLCLAAAGLVSTVAATAFSLSWTHSVERQEWREEWRSTPAGLELVEARVRGSGAGMEPPQGSRLVGGWWVYEPDLPPIPRLVLASSGATGGGWTFCAAGECREIGDEAGDPVVIAPCDSPE